MKIRHILTGALCAAMATAYAAPARRGLTHTMTQPDGTTVTLQLVGDENRHYYTTTDQHIVIGHDNRYTYAAIDAEGQLTNTGVLAHDTDMRTASEAALISTLKPEMIRKALAKKITDAERQPQSRAEDADYFGRLVTDFPTTGEVRTIVILAEYADVKFVTPNANDYFTRMLNEEGFSDNGAFGSCRDYFLDSSNGKFKGVFDVYGPVTLPYDQAYYGANNFLGADKNPQAMIRDAVRALDDVIDYNVYDLDGDKKIDNVFVFYAGIGESQGGGEDTVWPHQGTVAWNPTNNNFDGVQISRYACSSELQYGGIIDGIGTFVHEFGHVLGIPDLYTTNDAYATYTPGDYSVMDHGCYNNNGTQPPTYSAYERNAVGWLGDDLVEISGPASCRLEHILDSNKAYLIRTDWFNEIFLLENRQKKGWDAYLPGHGMLIWHIDYNATRWLNNEANIDKSHQMIDIVEASGQTGSTSMILRRYPFPGTLKVTEFVYGGNPSFESWSGYDMKLPITNITETDDVITFDVAGGGNDPAAITDAVASSALSYSIADRQITATAHGRISISDLTGRPVAAADGKLTSGPLTPGIYIINAGGESVKVAIK